MNYLKEPMTYLQRLMTIRVEDTWIDLETYDLGRKLLAVYEGESDA